VSDRQGRYRRRQEQGLSCFELVLPDDALAEFLIEEGMLSESESADHSACEAALARWVGKQISDRLRYA
jgi:hypothetical protein